MRIRVKRSTEYEDMGPSEQYERGLGVAGGLPHRRDVCESDTARGEKGMGN